MTEALETRVARIETLLGLRPDEGLAPIAAVVQDAATGSGLRVDQMTGPGRDAVAVEARRIAAWVIRDLWPDTSLRLIARALGRSDHTTILHALNRAAIRRATDPDFHRRTDDLVRRAKERMQS